MLGAAGVRCVSPGTPPAPGNARVAFHGGVLALEHWTSVDNIIAMLNDGFLRPGKDAKARGIGCGTGDVSYFIATPGMKPDPKRYTTNRTDACMFFECSLLDREDWFWNPGLNSGARQRNAILPGDLERISARAQEVATRTGNWCGEICFAQPISVRACFRIFVSGEDLKRRIIEATSPAWENAIVVKKPSEMALGIADVPRP
jgi:hypothetical protein